MNSLLIKQADIYTPAHFGRGDILVINGSIAAIERDIEIPAFLPQIRVIDARQRKVIPGIIDGHVHITGGGGEAGFKPKSPLQISTIVENGVTTVGGLLGTDNMTRNSTNVYAKACALEEEGISTFMIAGGYPVPPTLTGSIRNDIIFIEKVRGGKVAIADNRATPVTLEILADIATEVKLGGMMRNLNTVFVMHVGASTEGLALPLELAERYPHLAATIFPTHINRNQKVLDQAIAIVGKGGYLDISSGLNTQNLGPDTIKPSRAIAHALNCVNDPTHVLMSSDANGSALKYDVNGKLLGLTASSIASIHTEIRDAVVEEGLSLETALPVVTRNPALAYDLKGKGELAVGNDGDIVFLNDEYKPVTTIAMGRVCMLNSTVLVKGTFE